MNNLKLSVASAVYKWSTVTVNGEQIKLTKDNAGSYVGAVQVDDTAEITVERRHELTSPMWFLWSMFYFVISVFGIFDASMGKNMPINSRIVVNATENCALRINQTMKKNEYGLNIATKECVAEIVENEEFMPIIKKRRKILRIVKALTWVALIAIAITVVIIKFK